MTLKKLGILGCRVLLDLSYQDVQSHLGMGQQNWKYKLSRVISINMITSTVWRKLNYKLAMQSLELQPLE